MPDSQQTLSDITNSQPTSEAALTAPAKVKKSKTDITPMYVAYRRASHYAGNWALYTQANVDFYFDWSRVNSSYGFQSAGAFGLNTVQTLGINRSYSGGWQHSWIARTDAGVGSPTPWGTVNIYHRILIQQVNVYGDGAWNAWASE